MHLFHWTYSHDIYLNHCNQTVLKACFLYQKASTEPHTKIMELRVHARKQLLKEFLLNFKPYAWQNIS
jgi:hypothetical protein